jgi:hypothetical protein
MSVKVLISRDGPIEKSGVLAERQKVADALCVPLEDVLFIQGTTVQVVDVPDALTKEREKLDAAAEKLAKEKAAEDEKAAREEETRQAKAMADASRAASPAPAPAPVTNYDEWTLEDLHKEATARDLHGRSQLDKAGLVKALQKSDKGK